MAAEARARVPHTVGAGVAAPSSIDLAIRPGRTTRVATFRVERGDTCLGVDGERFVAVEVRFRARIGNPETASRAATPMAFPPCPYCDRWVTDVVSTGQHTPTPTARRRTYRGRDALATFIDWYHDDEDWYDRFASRETN